VQCFVQEKIAQLLPPITITARDQLALYKQKQEEGRLLQPFSFSDPPAAEQHRMNYNQRVLPQVQFLCKLAGPQALTQHAAALLKVPRMPRDLATLIKRAGLRLTEAHLVAAARGRVEGLEGWVVQPYLNIQCWWLDPLVQAICGSEVVSAC
jgi:hypothetical protein